MDDVWPHMPSSHRTRLPSIKSEFGPTRSSCLISWSMELCVLSIKSPMVGMELVTVARRWLSTKDDDADVMMIK
jgi:hypothetical protein